MWKIIIFAFGLFCIFLRLHSAHILNNKNVQTTDQHVDYPITAYSLCSVYKLYCHKNTFQAREQQQQRQQSECDCDCECEYASVSLWMEAMLIARYTTVQVHIDSIMHMRTVCLLICLPACLLACLMWLCMCVCACMHSKSLQSPLREL